MGPKTLEELVCEDVQCDNPLVGDARMECLDDVGREVWVRTLKRKEIPQETKVPNARRPGKGAGGRLLLSWAWVRNLFLPQAPSL